MGTFFFFIESIAIGLYILVGVLFFWNLRQYVMARSELTVAQFGLEREIAQRQGGRSVTMLFLCIEFVVIVWGISTLAAPTWRRGLPEENRVVDTRSFATSTPSNLGEFNPIPSSQPSGPDILQTAPPPSTPAGTIIAPGERIGCLNDQAWIDIPANGMLVFEPITVLGTANVENFAFYRFEIKANRSGANFAAIAADYTQPVTNGPLGQFIPGNFIDGGYRLRLVVFDTNSAPVASCEITIFISPPVPTDTPIGAGNSATNTPAE